MWTTGQGRQGDQTILAGAVVQVGSQVPTWMHGAPPCLAAATR